MYNHYVVEVKRGLVPRQYRAARARARGIMWLLALGLLLALAGPGWGYLAYTYSGKLVLAQQIPADLVARGFDFGPVYLERGSAGRYFLSALLPETESGTWHTTFEVLDEQKTPVFRQEELRFIGDFQFEPGQRDAFAKAFLLDRDTGYYYFRFTAVNGVYDTNPAAPPVVEFAVRQGVIQGSLLWLPVIGLIILGLLFIARAVVLINRLGAQPLESPHLRHRVQGQTEGRTYSRLRSRWEP